MDTAERFDFSDPQTQMSPFEAYRTLRDEHPVYRDPSTGFYVVLDHQLLRKVAGDYKRFSSVTSVITHRVGEIGERMQAIREEIGLPPTPVLLVTDPPLHGFHRSLVEKAFSPARVLKLQDYLTGVVNDLIDTFADAGKVEFVTEMSLMVPVSVVADFLGVDRSYGHDIKRWSDAAARTTDPSLPMDVVLESVRQECELHQFLLERTRAYREQPKDCLLSDVANADVDGRRLTETEVVYMIQQLVVAGHETTTSTMASAMLWMMNTPGLEERLRNDPAKIPDFIEEVLRLEAPLQGMFRRATEDVELGGVLIPAESVVVTRWGAGNRDPKIFPNPDALDIHRPNLRQHLAFGMGRHLCIGNQLARAELRIAFERLLAKLCNFRLQPGADAPEINPHYFIYGLKALPIEFDRR